MIILETKRLFLRTWQEEDVDMLYSINQDPRVMEFFPSLRDYKTTQEFVQLATRHFQEHQYTFFPAEIKATNEFIGFIGIWNVSFEARFTPAVEISWRLAFQHWGKGYAPEAALAVINYAFTQLNLTRIVSFTAVQNLRSQRVMEKIGMRRDSSNDFIHPSIPKEHPLAPHVFYQICPLPRTAS